jgi:hypothetical protein
MGKAPEKQKKGQSSYTTWVFRYFSGYSAENRKLKTENGI